MIFFSGVAVPIGADRGFRRPLDRSCLPGLSNNECLWLSCWQCEAVSSESTRSRVSDGVFAMWHVGISGLKVGFGCRVPTYFFKSG